MTNQKIKDIIIDVENNKLLVILSKILYRYYYTVVTYFLYSSWLNKLDFEKFYFCFFIILPLIPKNFNLNWELMPDLITHLAFTHLVKRPFELKGKAENIFPFRVLLYLGTICLRRIRIMDLFEPGTHGICKLAGDAIVHRFPD